VINNLDEIHKPSKGTDLIQRLQEQPKIEDIDTYDSSIKVEEKSPEEPQDTKKDIYAGMIKDGVEVVDVKAIEKIEKKEKIKKNLKNE